MAVLLLGQVGSRISIRTTDEVLDQIAHFLEKPPTLGGGFWLAGSLEGERNGEPVYVDPAHGHQRLWIPSTELVGLVYDRPLSPDPDVLPELSATVLI